MIVREATTDADLDLIHDLCSTRWVRQNWQPCEGVPPYPSRNELTRYRDGDQHIIVALTDDETTAVGMIVVGGTGGLLWGAVDMTLSPYDGQRDSEMWSGHIDILAALARSSFERTGSWPTADFQNAALAALWPTVLERAQEPT